MKSSHPAPHSQSPRKKPIRGTYIPLLVLLMTILLGTIGCQQDADDQDPVLSDTSAITSIAEVTSSNISEPSSVIESTQEESIMTEPPETEIETETEAETEAKTKTETETETETEAETETETEAETETETETETEAETETETEAETETETETEPETETETETETEPETDPVREPLDLSVEVDPYVPASPSYMTDVKAMWLSQFDLNAVYTSGGKQREENDFRIRIGDILQNVVDNGFNTVFLQVRPNADSFYPSEYYPPSKYVVGSYANDFTYDPFEIVIQEARARGLSIHAWINPLRGMSDAEIQQIDSSYAIRQWYDDGALCGTYLVKSGSLWYLNPAYAEVRDLIVYGAREILQRYDVDGIHMDDYFYPTQEASFDSTAYTAYKNSGGKLSLADWRRENLSDFVSRLYRVTKQQRADALFGISPAGTLNKVYANQYADVHRWCGEPGFVDYILPQVYFGFEHATMPFDGVCNQWRDIIKTDYVNLLIGVTFGKASSKYDQWAGSGKNEWAEHTDILARSIIYTLTLDKCRGMSVFCYQYFYDPVTGIPNASTAAEREGFIAILQEASWEE